ncbi:MAG: 4Fe-4S dicluster domain-containing protein [Acidilobaceae archaeon]
MSGVAVIVDLDKCVGCRACQVACQSWNGREALITEFTPDFTNPPDLHANSWKVVKFIEYKYKKTLRLDGTTITREDYGWTGVPINCMHCVDPPCSRICPARAITVSPEGAVVIDKNKCIGCKFCGLACPFNVPRYGKDGKAYKCTFCVDRLQAGMVPSCVAHCPAGVFTLTTLEEAREIAKDLEAKGKVVYGFSLGSYVGDSVRWIFTISKEKADQVLPKVFPEKPVNINVVKETLESVAPPIFGLAGLAIVAGLALAWWRASRVGEKK